MTVVQASAKMKLAGKVDTIVGGNNDEVRMDVKTEENLEIDYFQMHMLCDAINIVVKKEMAFFSKANGQESYIATNQTGAHPT